MSDSAGLNSAPESAPPVEPADEAAADLSDRDGASGPEGRRPGTSGSGSVDTGLVLAMAVMAGIGVLPMRPAPTGLTWWDFILTLCFVGVVVVAGSRASLEALGWAAAAAIISTALVGPSAWTAFALVAFVLAWFARSGRKVPLSTEVLAAASVGASIIALFRLGSLGFWGVPSIITVLAVLPVLLSGRAALPERSNRWVRDGFKAAAVLAAVCFLSLAITGLRAQGPTRSAADAAQRAIDAVSAGDSGDASAQLRLAAVGLGEAGDAVNGIIAAPGRLVPVASQHLRVGGVALSNGAELSAVGADALAAADVDNLRTPDGSFAIDRLEAMIAAANDANALLPPVADAFANQSDAWLIPPIADVTTQAREGLADAARLSAEFNPLLQVVPEMMGEDRPMRYFVMLGTPAEARELGGLLGGYAVIQIANGSVELVEAGNNSDLIERSQRDDLDLDFDGYTEFFVEIYEPDTYAQNFTGIPDLRLAAQAIDDVFGDFAGAPIDGVVYLDPYALEAFVGLAGPLRVTGLDAPLTGDTTADFLLKGQYERFDDPDQRKAFLVSMLEETFSSLLAIDISDPRRVADVMIPIVRGGRLQMAMLDDDLSERLARTDLLRQWPANTGADFVALLESNAAPTKLDAYLFRDWSYDLTFDPATGDVAGTIRLELTNSAPEGLPTYVTQPDEVVLGAEDRRPIDNWTFVSLISPLQVSEVRSEGTVQELIRFNELGYNRWFSRASVRPERPTIIEWDVFGTLAPGDYVLRIAHQPLVNEDRVRVTVAPTDGWTLDGGTATWSFTLTENLTIVARAERE